MIAGIVTAPITLEIQLRLSVWRTPEPNPTRARAVHVGCAAARTPAILHINSAGFFRRSQVSEIKRGMPTAETTEGRTREFGDRVN